jgi:hypothetical protein
MRKAKVMSPRGAVPLATALRASRHPLVEEMASRLAAAAELTDMAPLPSSCCSS